MKISYGIEIIRNIKLKWFSYFEKFNLIEYILFYNYGKEKQTFAHFSYFEKLKLISYYR